jgi:signal-transduction protein with cAMP-binding, CBS, and nucleotidyltransferase domain
MKGKRRSIVSSTSSYPATADILPNIPARDLLISKPKKLWSVEAGATVYRAIELMAEGQVGALVVTKAGKLVGIVSERDYARKVILMGRASQSTSVEAIMTSEVVTVTPETSLQECMQLMTSRRIRHLPVLDGDQLIGMVSIGDVVRETLARQSHTIDELQRYVTGEPRLAPTAP